MLRLAMTVSLLVVTLAPAATRAGAKSGDGWLYLQRFVPEAQKKEFKGFVEPRLYVYDDSGVAVASDRPGGHYAPGELVEVPEGWYQVEVALVPHKANRWRYYVKRGRTTVVRSGLVILPTTPVREQPADTCKQWRAIMEVYVTDAAGDLQFIMSNRNDDVDDFGMLQLHEGTYTFLFNGLSAPFEVKAGRTMTLPTAKIGPIPHPHYRLSRLRGDSVDAPPLELCSQRPTQVLAGTWWGSFYVDTMAAPFRKRIWEEQIIEPRGKLQYKHLKEPKGHPRYKAFRGKGSTATKLVQPPPTRVPVPASPKATREVNPIPAP